ncbi:MAG TPA: hydroxyethylthiazole kinase, partial [Clostridia bacterium]|nr:hydroxyethylthiazole kinase [Clostridia bacterium]
TARSLAQRKGATVVVTGREDIVTDGYTLFRVQNGHPMMTSVVGTGCMAASVIGTFAAVERNLPAAAASGLACYEIAAELAAEQTNGPATFKIQLFDRLFRLDQKTVERRLKVISD